MTSFTARCCKCVLSSSFPNITFDENGLCSFCRDEMHMPTEAATIERAQQRIEQLFASERGRSEYDAIMCYSGGKDSTYTLLTAVKKYNLKVLAFTLDNGFTSPAAFANIRRICEELGVDQITFTPSPKFFKPLIKVSALQEVYSPKTLIRISAICHSCISVVNNSALKLALEKEVPFILAGFTLGQIPANGIVYKNNYHFFRESREIYLERLRASLGDTVDDYFGLKESLLNDTKAFPYNVNLLCVEDPTEAEMYQAIEELGWVSPKDVDGCSSNCRLNGFNNFIHQKNFHYSPYELELSHLIRKGKISREEALQKLSDTLQPEVLTAIMEELAFSEEEIRAIGI